MTKILQIEDNPANKILVERVLEAQGYDLYHAADGESGFATALEQKPDLILIDMGLPDIDGQSVVALMRQVPELANIPIVAITAWPADTAMEMAQRYGCDGCITKPIDIRKFPAQVAAYLED